jgi:hypothetical protein
MTFDDAADLVLSCAPVGGFLWGQNPFVCTDQIATFTTDDGQEGICCVEVSLRQQRDDPGIIGAATGVAVRDGFAQLSGPPVRSFSW